MNRHRNTARLVEALAELKEFDKQNTRMDLTLYPHLAQQRRRIDIRITELASAAGMAHYELGDLDDDVRAFMLRRRSSQRRNVRSAHNDYAGSIAGAF